VLAVEEEEEEEEEDKRDSTGNLTMGTPQYSQPPFQPPVPSGQDLSDQVKLEEHKKSSEVGPKVEGARPRAEMVDSRVGGVRGYPRGESGLVRTEKRAEVDCFQPVTAGGGDKDDGKIQDFGEKGLVGSDTAEEVDGVVEDPEEVGGNSNTRGVEQKTETEREVIIIKKKRIKSDVQYRK